MKKYIKDLSMKKLDFLLIFVLLILSLVPLLIFNKGNVNAKENSKYLSIQVNGKEIKHVDLQKGKSEVIPISKGGKVKNVVEVKDGVVDMIEADCPDQLCVRATPISSIGDTIVCLPNRVVLEIKGLEEASIDNKEDKSDINSY